MNNYHPENTSCIIESDKFIKIENNITKSNIPLCQYVDKKIYKVDILFQK